MSKKTKRRIVVVVLSVVALFVIGLIATVLLNVFDKNGSSYIDYYDGYEMAVEDSSGSSYLAEPMLEKSYNDEVSSTPAAERMIIKTGSVSMVVKDVREAIKAISAYATEKGGFVVSSNVSKYDLSVSGDITFRIPSEIFGQGVLDVKAMGEVKSESVYGQDVTEEFVDLESQLGNLRATEAQFLEIMKSAFKIEDVLAVQRELGTVRGQIEGIEGRMKYLKESASLSTLTVYLSTDPGTLPVLDEEKWAPFTVVKNAVRSLIEVGKWLVDALIWIVIYIPIWILGLLVLWGLGKLGKKAWVKLWG